MEGGAWGQGKSPFHHTKVCAIKNDSGTFLLVLLPCLLMLLNLKVNCMRFFQCYFVFWLCMVTFENILCKSSEASTILKYLNLIFRFFIPIYYETQEADYNPKLDFLFQLLFVLLNTVRELNPFL